MVSKFSSDNLIADRYAFALYDLSLEFKCVEVVLSDLMIILEYINQNKEFKLLMQSPLIASSEKLKIVEKILKDHSANSLTSNFIKVVSYNKRLNNLSSIISRFSTINAEKRGDVIADVTSADKLSAEQKNSVANQLYSILGKKLFLNFIVDKKIIGGLIIKVGSKMIDSSLASKINKLKIAMKEA